MKNTVRLNFEFPSNEYPDLKKILAYKHISFRDFATKVILEAMKEAEDEILVKEAKKRLETMKSEDLISWNQAARSAGWTDDEI